MTQDIINTDCIYLHRDSQLLEADISIMEQGFNTFPNKENGMKEWCSNSPKFTHLDFQQPYFQRNRLSSFEALEDLPATHYCPALVPN